MANKRVVDGEDTPTRLERVWADVVEKDEYPSLAEFARRVPISYPALCHHYREFADKVRNRRDKKRGPRKFSPVTLSKGTGRSLAEALSQVDEQAKTIAKLRAELERATQQRDNLQAAVNRLQPAAAENEKWRGLLVDLEDQLKLVGLPQSKIALLWEMITKRVTVIRDPRAGK